MQVNISITLTQDDIDAGLTADAAVQKAFPNGTTESTHVDTPLVQDVEAIQAAAEAAAQEELDEQLKVAVPAPPTPPTLVQDPVVDYDEVVDQEPEAVENPDGPIDNAETDSAGVPWSAEIHSSNQKKYGPTSKEPGRWQWKKGSDPVARAQRAAELRDGNTVGATEDSGAGGTDTPPPATVIPVPENGASMGSPVPPVASSPSNNVPPAAVHSEVAGDVPATWPAFLQSLKASGKTAGDITPLLAQNGVETIAQLASNAEARNSIANTLGLVA